MKKVIVIIFLLITFMISTFIYYIKFSEDAEIGEQNIENYRKIRIKMDSTEVVAIMGKPFDSYDFEANRVLVYNTPPLYSEVIKIVIDTTNKVIDFYPSYETID